MGIAPHQFRQYAVVSRTDEGQGQSPDRPCPQVARHGSQIGHGADRRPDMFQPLAAEGSHRHLTFCPDEERRTQFAFQCHDRLAEWRLRHAQPLSGTTEMQFLCHGKEMVELAQVHLIHSSCDFIASLQYISQPARNSV